MSRRLAALLGCLLLAACTSSGNGRGPSGPGVPLPTASPRTNSGHAGPSTPAGFQLIRVPTTDGGARKAFIDRPTPGPHHRPLILFFHGARSVPSGPSDPMRLNDAAMKAGVIVAYPLGDPATGSWRIGCCSSYATNAADFDFVSQLIKSLVADGEVDPAHVVLVGFSAGAFFANGFACRHADQVSAVVALAGGLLAPPTFVASATPAQFRCSPARPVTMLEVHGSADTAVPVSGSTNRCGASSCRPGTRGYVAPAQIIDQWWRRMDGCSPPTSRPGSQATTSLAACRDGTHVGLAVVDGVAHDLVGLGQHFDVDDTVLQLALARPLTAW